MLIQYDRASGKGKKRKKTIFSPEAEKPSNIARTHKSLHLGL